MGILSMLFKIGVDSTAFELNLKRMQSLGEKFGSSFKSAVTSRLGQALSVGAVYAFSRSVINAADEIGDLSEQLNITTDDVQRLQILAGQTGVKFEKFSAIIEKTSKARLEALSGDVEQINVFNALGISIGALSNRQTTNLDLALRIAEAYKRSGQSAQTTAAITDLYGIKLRSAAAALAEYQSTADKQLISEETINSLSKSNDLLDEQWRRLKALSSPVIASGLEKTASALEALSSPPSAENEAMYRRFGLMVDSRINQMAMGNIPGASSALAIASQNKPLEGTTPSAKPKPTVDLPTLMFQLAKGDRFALGGASDPLSKIGGFTGFQTTQDSLIKQAIEQTLQLKVISQNTKKTADKLVD